MLKKALFLPLLFAIAAVYAQPEAVEVKKITITIDGNSRAQTIRNIGASGCWFSEGIGKDWPEAKREKIAELLFSAAVDAKGNPKGIALSAWRFNIGGGTAEQGDSSGIPDFRKRVECFLSPDGAYNWNKQAGYQWFLRKAKDYGVPDLIAFANTPPVQFTKNGLGYKTSKDYQTNLRNDKYDAYADFLATVLKHFDNEGLHFNYISPVNEPQWDWAKEYGKASQEGSPWSNAQIAHVIQALSTKLDSTHSSARILTTEAGMLTYLYSGNTASSKQIQQLYGRGIGLLPHMPKIVGGHSYFTDGDDKNLINVRKNVADTAAKYGLEFWQTEYSMLGDGFREGTGKPRTAMDCALFLAKVMHHDLTVANAAAWQLWNSYEPGSADVDTRYYLIALQPNAAYTDGDFTITKNLWAMGNYSRFVRPGMVRLNTRRDDGLDTLQQAQNVMVSAFAGNNKKPVLVAINYTTADVMMDVKTLHLSAGKGYITYTTSAAKGDDLRASALTPSAKAVQLPPRSVTTIVFK